VRERESSGADVVLGVRVRVRAHLATFNCSKVRACSGSRIPRIMSAQRLVPQDV
jgi:hypothetical protein